MFTENFVKNGQTPETARKNELWNWGSEQEKEFGKTKQMLTEGPCLPQFAKDKDNIVTTDASMKGLGITLWQKI